MVKQLNQFLTEASNTFDINMMKIDAVMEATARELQINYASAELKVLQESGTDADLRYLCEEANNGLVERAIEGIKKIIASIQKFFSDMKDKIIAILHKKENKEKIDQIEKKVKLFPLLGKKKILVENTEKEMTCADKHLSLIAKLQAKFKSGQTVEEEEIEEVERSFMEEHGKLIGIGAAVSVTVVGAIAMFKKYSAEAVEHGKNGAAKFEEGAKAMQKAIKAKAGDISAAIGVKLESAHAAILKAKETSLMRGIIGSLARIKSAVKSFVNTAVDTAKALGDKLPSGKKKKGEVAEESTFDALLNAITMMEADEEPIEDVDPEADIKAEDGERSEDDWDELMKSLADDTVADDDETDECGDTFESVYKSLFGDEDETVEESAFDSLMKEIDNL